MMEPIGGYFSLELPWHEEYHIDAMRLNTGRNCLEYILLSRKYRKVYLPYYTCEVVIEPFEKTGTKYAFYHIDINLEIDGDIELEDDEALLYTNYFGLKQRYVETLAEQYGNQLIVDNTQAFYAKPVQGIDTFYTCRKFFGVPDGAYLYTDKRLELTFEQDISWSRFPFLTKRIDIGPEAGYADFHEMEDKLIGQPIKLMSQLARRLMQAIDYEAAAIQRSNNYLTLQESLGKSNQINLKLEEDAIPMVYPYMIDIKGIREQLIKNKIFVACYWPNVLEWTTGSSLENKLVNRLLPLPTDQRYCQKHMKNIVETLSK